MSRTNAWWAEHLQSARGRSFHVAPDDPAEWLTIHETAELLGFELFKVSGDQVDSKISLLDTLNTVMSFPAYFGRNWDALEECINDLSWWSSHGYIFLLTKADILLKSSPDDFGTFVRIAADASESWASKGTAFHVVFTGTTMVGEAAAHAIEGNVCDHRLL